MTKKVIFILALLLATVQGAWADNEWDAVYILTQTTSANWTALNASSTTGKTLGSAGTTTYYYVAGDLSFTNSTPGGSGLTIQGTVYLYIPTGSTLTCTGANASGQTGAGAGIELVEGNTLNLLGGAPSMLLAVMLPTAATALAAATPVALIMYRLLLAPVAKAALAVAEPVPA